MFLQEAFFLPLVGFQVKEQPHAAEMANNGRFLYLRSMEPLKPEIIPEKILEEVRLRKDLQKRGLCLFFMPIRQSGRTLVDRLMNETEDAILVTPKELPPSRA